MPGTWAELGKAAGTAAEKDLQTRKRARGRFRARGTKRLFGYGQGVEVIVGALGGCETGRPPGSVRTRGSAVSGRRGQVSPRHREGGT